MKTARLNKMEHARLCFISSKNELYAELAGS